MDKKTILNDLSCRLFEVEREVQRCRELVFHLLENERPETVCEDLDVLESRWLRFKGYGNKIT